MRISLTGLTIGFDLIVKAMLRVGHKALSHFISLYLKENFKLIYFQNSNFVMRFDQFGKAPYKNTYYYYLSYPSSVSSALYCTSVPLHALFLRTLLSCK